MTEIEKFSADVKRIVKHDRADHGGSYDGLRAAQKAAELFSSYSKELAGLPESIADYWLHTYVEPSADADNEPSEEHVEWLASALAFLAGDERECVGFSAADWRTLCDLVNYEAEDLPIDVLSDLMTILVNRKAL